MLAVVAGTLPAGATVADPVVEGPITVGSGPPFVAGTAIPLGDFGYVQEEFFISGTASAYSAVGALESDGEWTAQPAGTAAYKTRILVYRPERPRKFKGTVVVEWLNVSGGLDSAPDWIMAHTEMMRSGMIWVGVSAQFVGVEGGGGGLLSLPLKTVDAVRYGSLSHPGDSFSYDMFSQAGQAIVGPSGPTVLGGLAAERVIAIGESQSAFRLVTYVNAVHPLAGVFDGFLIHSRGAGGTALSQAPEPVVGVPSVVFIRNSMNVPVLTLQMETDLVGLVSYASRQPDTGIMRLWEVAGTAHGDTYTLLAGMTDRGDDPSVVDVIITQSPIPGIIECQKPINSGPQHFVVKAALAGLERWVKYGKPPPSAPLLETVSAGNSVDFVLDGVGNVLGGIRTPWVDVPVATHSGLGQTGGGFCFLFGTTELLDAPTLASLYPTHRDYVKKVKKATKRSRDGKFILRKDAKLIRAAAKASDIGN